MEKTPRSTALLKSDALVQTHTGMDHSEEVYVFISRMNLDDEVERREKK